MPSPFVTLPSLTGNERHVLDVSETARNNSLSITASSNSLSSIMAPSNTLSSIIASSNSLSSLTASSNFPISTTALDPTSSSINSLKCMLINSRSLNNKIYKLTELFEEHSVNICCVTETWLKEGADPLISDLNREGYNIISMPRNNKKRGGGIAFLSETNKYQRKQAKTSIYQTFEILEVLVYGKSNNIRFSTVYRTGYLSEENRVIFLKEMNDYMELLIPKEGLNLIWGDFNIPLDKKSKLSVDFIDLMESNGFKQLIHRSTHINGGILDLVFVPFDFQIQSPRILDSEAISDHYPIEVNLTLITNALPSHSQMQRRNLSQIDENIFKSNIKLPINKIFSQETKDTNELNEKLMRLNDALLFEINFQAPLVTKNQKITGHIVKNKDIQEARRAKRRAENKFKKTGLEEDKNKLKKQRKILIGIVEQSRNQLFKDKLSSCKNNVQETYKVINQLLNKNNEKIFPTHCDEKLLANRFAKFYKEKIEKIRKNLEVPKQQPFSSNVQSLFPFVEEMNEFRMVDDEEIVCVIRSLQNKQSVLDPIPCKLLKNCQKELLPAFKNIINASFEMGYFPDQLKVATVTPVIKSKSLDSELLNNYRPVSSLPIMEKIIEKCSLKQINEHLTKNYLYCKHQSAYREGHSCETALIKIYDDLLNFISPTTYAVVIFLDFSAAFDTIDHNILIERLRSEYYIKNKALAWMSSYLKRRSYQVKINNTLSDYTPLNFGVPQGSILGPVLFSLYIKEINNIADSHKINIHFYADDAQLYMRCDQNTDFTNIIKCLEKIHQWSSYNCLKLNKEKTKILAVSSTSYQGQKITHLNIMGEKLKVETSVKNLGFYLDEHLTMSKQINYVCAQGYRMISNLWKISKKVVDKDLRTQLVHSGVLSKVNYCNSLYNSLPATQTRKLQKLINSATRFIFNIRGKQRYQHITPYLQQLHFLPVEYRSDFKVCLMVFKCFKENTPAYLKELIKIRKPNPWQSLRKDSDGYLLDYETPATQNYKNRGFSYIAPKLWNVLPYSIRNSVSMEAFKSNLKTFYYNKWKLKTCVVNL